MGPKSSEKKNGELEVLVPLQHGLLCVVENVMDHYSKVSHLDSTGEGK